MNKFALDVLALAALYVFAFALLSWASVYVATP